MHTLKESAKLIGRSVSNLTKYWDTGVIPKPSRCGVYHYYTTETIEEIKRLLPPNPGRGRPRKDKGEK